MSPIVNRPSSVAGLALGLLVAAAPMAFADHAYPPGWNRPENVAPPMYDFRPGANGDYKRYWPDQAGPGDASSRKMTSGPTIYQMVPGGRSLSPGAIAH